VAALARVIAAAAPVRLHPTAALPLARRLAEAAVATLLLNGFNFVLGLWLVRTLAPRAFGVWAMLTTVQAIAGVFLTALVAQQMAHVLPRLHHEARQRAGAKMFTSVATWCAGAFVPVSAISLSALGVLVAVVAAGSAFVAATTLRNHARFHLYALRRTRAVLAQDALFVALAAAGVVAIVVAGRGDDLAALLIALTIASVAAVWWRSALALPVPTRARMRRHAAAYQRHAARAGWSLATVALSTLSALAPNLALASTGSLAALAVVAAPAAVLAPVRLVALTFQSALRAEFAALIHAERRRAALWLYATATLLALLACLSLGGALWAGWDWLSARVFARGYDRALLREATLLAFGVAAVNVVRLPGAVLLNALGVFRFSAATLGLVVPVVLASACWLAHRGAVAAVLYPALFGEIALFVAELAALRARMR